MSPPVIYKQLILCSEGLSDEVKAFFKMLTKYAVERSCPIEYLNNHLE
jgi:hypothetical protein